MGEVAKCREVLTLFGRIINEVVSFIVFCILDVVDTVLCYVYKVADFYFEAEWRPCYCSSAKDAITSRDKIFVSEHGESKVVRMSSTKLQLDEVSDTLYARSSRVSEVSKATVMRLKEEGSAAVSSSSERIRRSSSPAGTVRSTFMVDAAVVEMLHGRIFGQQNQPIRRWSDCKCKHCTSWTSKGKKGLFVKAAGAKPDKAREDVLFIHGFISSSVFWTETLFPNFSEGAKSTYRFLAVDLLGFGRSPKPNDSLYTLREHLDMIEQSVLEQYKVKNVHIVAHSLGCILALALAVKNPGAVKSLTLLAPPYYPIPKGVQATQYVMRKVAPRRVWPIIGFGASIACWYEHITRTACLVVCKNHRFWESLTKLLTRNRIRTYMFEGFFCHTFNAAWHTVHNIICGTAGRIDAYLDIVRDRLKCDVTVFHGRDDELIPVECSYNVQRRIRRARVRVIDDADHLTIVIGRPKDFAVELEEIWRKSSC